MLFPAMAPAADSRALAGLPPDWGVAAGAGRSAATQGGMQMLALVISVVIGCVGGALTGQGRWLGDWVGMRDQRCR